MLRIKSPQDIGAAVVIILVGIAGIYFGWDLRFGTASRMGPGYFPYYLSWCIVGLGLIIGGRGLVLAGPPLERPQLRPLLMVVVATLFFGYLIEYVGLVVSTVALILIAAYAQKTVNLKESVLLAVGMTLFIVVVFVWALQQPLPLWGI